MKDKFWVFKKPDIQEIFIDPTAPLPIPIVKRLNVDDLNFVEECKYIIVLCNAE